MAVELKIGLVGCGGISEAHARGYLALDGVVRVTAVCDVDPDRARARAAQLGAERVYTSLDELLAESGVDAVDLCLPHRAHAPATIAAAQAGKHVLVEKPIAASLDEADAMITAARKAGVKLMVAHNQRYHALHVRVRELLDEGAIGRVYCARADNNMDFKPPAGHFIYSREAAGGGALIGYGVHRIDLLRWYLGEVREVAHFQTREGARFEGEASALTILKFADRAIGEVAVNWMVRNPPWMDMLWLYGDNGSIHNIGGLHVDSERGGPRVEEVPATDPFAEQIRHFARCVLEDREPLTSGPEARRTLEVVVAAYRSAATGTVVNLPLKD